jgi:glycine/serine hydroxymethyltransferase
MDMILTDAENEATVREVRREVNAYMEDFPLYETAAVA